MNSFKFLADINEIRYVILALIILVLLTILIKVIISGLNYANRKILKCDSIHEDVKLFGRNIFKEKWIDTNEKVLVYDPSYNEEHLFCIYKVIIDDKEYRFAEGEFANGYYAFYVYNPHMYDK